jgi:hypothetical protein
MGNSHKNLLLRNHWAVFYTSGNIFVRRTGTFVNMIFSLVSSDNHNTRSTFRTSVFTGTMRGVISQHHPGGHQKSYLQLHSSKNIRPSLSSTHAQLTRERMETACSSNFMHLLTRFFIQGKRGFNVHSIKKNNSWLS